VYRGVADQAITRPLATRSYFTQPGEITPDGVAQWACYRKQSFSKDHAGRRILSPFSRRYFFSWAAFRPVVAGMNPRSRRTRLASRRLSRSRMLTWMCAPFIKTRKAPLWIVRDQVKPTLRGEDTCRFPAFNILLCTIPECYLYFMVAGRRSRSDGPPYPSQWHDRTGWAPGSPLFRPMWCLYALGPPILRTSL
jgi:hypothetical protein